MVICIDKDEGQSAEIVEVQKPFFLKSYAVLVVITILVIIMILPDFLMFSGTDYGVYFNNGRLLREGQIPYKDFWDHKTPGLSIYLAVWQGIFGSNWVAAKLSLISIYVLWGVALFTICKMTLKNSLLATIVALCGVYYVLRLGFDPARNGAILVLSTAAELLALSLIFSLIQHNSHNLRYKILIGFLAGFLSTLAFLIRQTSIVPFLVLSVLLIDGYFIKKKEGIIFVAVGYSLGLIVLVVLTVVLMNIIGLGFFDIKSPLIDYNRLYADYYMSLSPGEEWVTLLKLDITWWVPVLAGLFWIKQKEATIRNFDVEQTGLKFLYLCLAVALILTISGIKPQSYYKIQYFPYLFIIAVAIILAVINNYPKQPYLIVITITLIAGIFLGGSLIISLQSDLTAFNQWYKTAKNYNFQMNNLPDQVIAKEILSLTNAKKIFIHGNRSWLYILTGTTSPIKYYYDAPLFRNGYLTQNEFDTILSEFMASPPEIIVYWPNRPMISEKIHNSAYLEEFEKYVRDHYQLVKEIALPEAWPYVYKQPVYIYTYAKESN